MIPRQLRRALSGTTPDAEARAPFAPWVAQHVCACGLWMRDEFSVNATRCWVCRDRGAVR